MASANDIQAGRDAESFDNDRKEGRYDRDYFSRGVGSGPDLSISEERSADIARIAAETNALFDRLMAPKAPKLERAA
jgi:hypothetical protein